MKKYWNYIMDFLGFHDEQGVFAETEQKHSSPARPKIVSLNRKQYKLIFHHPESYNEVKTIVDDIKEGKPVIINLEGVEIKQARRIIDFVSGAVYGLVGNVQKAGKQVFLFTPGHIDVDAHRLNKVLENNVSINK